MWNEVISSCACSPVAEAAVRSLGPSFAYQVKSVARARGFSIGAYASRAVSRFGAEASPAARQALAAAMRGSDQPILAGVAFVLELAMDDDGEIDVAPHRSIMPVPELRAAS